MVTQLFIVFRDYLIEVLPFLVVGLHDGDTVVGGGQ